MLLWCKVISLPEVYTSIHMDVALILAIILVIILLFNNIIVLVGFNLIPDDRTVSTNILSVIASLQCLFGIAHLTVIKLSNDGDVNYPDYVIVYVLCAWSHACMVWMTVLFVSQRLMVMSMPFREDIWGDKSLFWKYTAAIMFIALLKQVPYLKQCAVCGRIQLWIDTILVQIVTNIVVFSVTLRLSRIAWVNHQRRKVLTSNSIRNRLFKYTLMELNTVSIATVSLLFEIPYTCLHILSLARYYENGMPNFEYIFKLILTLSFVIFLYLHMTTRFVFRNTVRSLLESVFCPCRENDEIVHV